MVLAVVVSIVGFGGLIGILAALIVAIFGRLLADELNAWTPWMAERLISYAAARLSKARRARWTEEWQSHANELPGSLAKLLHAIGAIAAAYKIAWLEAKMSIGRSAQANAETQAGMSQVPDQASVLEMWQQIDRKLARLSERDRQILTAIFLHNADRDELCRAIGVSRDHLRVLIHRALTEIRRND